MKHSLLIEEKDIPEYSDPFSKITIFSRLLFGWVTPLLKVNLFYLFLKFTFY